MDGSSVGQAFMEVASKALKRDKGNAIVMPQSIENAGGAIKLSNQVQYSDTGSYKKKSKCCK